MAYQPNNVGATFVPGGFDDYYIAPPPPELVSPAPQRLMPEMSDQIQGGMANMNMNQPNNTSSQALYSYTNQSSQSAITAFPKLHNPPPNVPPSDEEFETTLDNARTAVLAANDPEMQLAWAQDALQQVGIEVDNRDRIEATQGARSTTPSRERQLQIDAMNIVSFLADQHHPKAEFMKGMWFEFGKFGCPADKKEAFRCFSRSADRGYARAEYRVGMLFEAAGDPIKALKHYYKGVELGDSACLYRVGMMTLRGQHGQPQDFYKGVGMVRQAAQEADDNAPQGAYVYGMLLARQLPQIDLPDGALPYDEKAARIEIEKAAYMRFAKAQLKMGSAYELGTLGCEFSPALSMHYYALAAKQGEPEAEMGISKWLLVGHENLFPKNEELAYVYAQRAANTGFANAEFAMGYFNELGIHVARDLDIAIEWYRKAASNGNTDAQGRLDGLSRKQVLSRRDHENVAITRIKSQYGSQRGSRPARFQAQPSRMGPLPDQAAQHKRNPSADFPPRSSSTTPYPLEDGPPVVPPTARPGSTAPYPLEDGPPTASLPLRRPSLMDSYSGASNMPHPEERPSSAFSFVTEHRPTSAASMPVNRMRYPSGPSGPPRPATASVDPRARPAPGGRHASSPASSQNQSYEAPPPMPNSMHSMRPLDGAPSPAPLDIGFSAPLDNRRTRPQRQNPSTDKPHPPKQQLGQPQQTSSSDRPYAARTSSRPEPGRTATPNINGPPINVTAPTPQPTPPPALKPSTTKPPHKGPTTFDEMGVPATKQESECIVM